MPQSTDLNTPPYFEDFDPDKNFHRVLFRPGYPLQARELTQSQSILQDQIEKFGKSIYKEGDQVVPGQVGFDLKYTAILIEDEYFGIPGDALVATPTGSSIPYIVGQTIIGNTTGVKARVVNALTSSQSEKSKTTLYLKYVSAGTANTSGTFADDEIILAQDSFSIGTTVIQANTDFAKCVSSSATHTGSSAKITEGVYFAKGHFVKVLEQEIVLDQFGVSPSYKVGLQILEEIVTPEEDTTLTDPSQGYSNYSAPGAHRLKLKAVLSKKALSDTSSSDFIELLRLDDGDTKNFNNNRETSNIEDILARRTYDESGDYEVRAYDFTKDECLTNGINNGVFETNTTTDDGNTPSKDLFDIAVSPGKSYVRGYELENLETTYVDINKPRTTEILENSTIPTDGRGTEFVLSSPNSGFITQSLVAGALNGATKVGIKDSGSAVIGYAILVAHEDVKVGGVSQKVIVRLINISFLSGKDITDVVGGSVNFGGTINWASGTISGGTDYTINKLQNVPKPLFFKVSEGRTIKSTTDTKVQSVQSFASGTIDGSGNIQVAGNYFSTNEDDYTVVINGVTTSVNVTSVGVVGGTVTLAVANAGSDFTLIGPEKIDTPTQHLISHKKMRTLRLTDDAKTPLNGEILTLGTTKVSKIHAIYQDTSGTTAETDLVPKITLTSSASTTSFEVGEVFVGRTSGSKGRIIKQAGNVIWFVYLSNTNFIANETLFGFNSSSTRSISAVNNQGAANIKDRYILDDGQRDQAFNYSKLIKKSVDSSISTDSRLVVIFDYFNTENNDGVFSTVESFYDADFDDIPSYEFNGERLYLSDLIDWRVDAAPILSGTGEINTGVYTINVASITGSTTAVTIAGEYANTNYQQTGRYLLPSGTTDADTEFYLGRNDELYLDKGGKFISKAGIPSLFPERPSDALANAMKVLSIEMPPYIRNLNDVKIRRHYQRRYTMKDIGGLESRITNIEYYTQLSLLETDTKNLFIADGSGNNRLKNGFLVDNFSSHSIGDPREPNYKCSMDTTMGELRPQHYSTNSTLVYDTEPTNYMKGDLLMLNYTDQLLVEQPYACVLENVNPFAVVSWVGLMNVFPASDDWIEENRLPESLTEVEGDYEAKLRELGIDANSGFGPTEWNSWETQWTSSSTSTRRWTERSAGGGAPIRRVVDTTTTTTSDQSRSGIRSFVTPRVDRKVLGDRVVDTKYAHFKRSRNFSITGYRLKPNIRVYPFLDGRDISAYSTPKIIEISMTAGSVAFNNDEDIVVTGNVNRKFKCKLGQPQGGIAKLNKPYSIDPYTGNTITSTAYSTTSTFLNLNIATMQKLAGNSYGGYLLEGDIIAGVTSGATATVTKKHLIADDKGNLRASIFIPDPIEDSNPRWKTGESIVRLTDSPSNSLIPGDADSSAEGTYSANGTILTKQSDVLLVRNAEVVHETVTDQRTITTSSTQSRAGGWYDPLAQSFLIEEAGGCFISKIDVYFNTKDTALPVTMQIREMVNGYPSPTILGTVNLDPSNVNISDDALTATTFVFETPVYLLERKEYCFALLTSSVEYKVWLSEMGKDDLNGERISKQPYAGVLFKSQNASTWTTAEMQDMKFKIYRAKFDITETPSVIMNVDTSGNLLYTKLRRDPIELTVNSGRMKVYHKNHGMYDSASYVELKGISSEVYADLDADFNGAAGSAITLTGSYNGFKYNQETQTVGTLNALTSTFTVPSAATLNVGDVVTTSAGTQFAANTRVTNINGNIITISPASTNDPAENSVGVIFTNPIKGVLPSNSNPAYIKIGECVYSYDPLSVSNLVNNQYTVTTIALIEGTAPSSGFKKDSGWQAEHYVVNGIPLIEVNKVHNQLEYITLDSYQIDLSSLTRTLATTNTTFGGANVYASRNVAYNSLMPLIGYRELPGTAVDASFRSTSGTSLGNSAFSNPSNSSQVPTQRSYKRDSAFSPIALNEHNYFNTPRVIASAINEERQMVGSQSGQLQFTLSSTSDNLSPVIDQDRMSIVTTGNRVTDFDGTFDTEYFFNNDSQYVIGESPKQDFNAANYITKLITVTNECTSLRIDFAAYNSSETDIDVYVKLLTGDETNPGDQSWEELTTTNYTGSKNEFNFVDYTYQKDLSAKQFTQYQIKLRMRSRNAAVAPIIKDLRCIALA